MTDSLPARPQTGQPWNKTTPDRMAPKYQVVRQRPVLRRPYRGRLLLCWCQLLRGPCSTPIDTGRWAMGIHLSLLRPSSELLCQWEDIASSAASRSQPQAVKPPASPQCWERRLASLRWPSFCKLLMSLGRRRCRRRLSLDHQFAQDYRRRPSSI